MKKLCLVILTLFLLTACGSKKEEVSNFSNEVRQEFFIKGDLKAFYEGTQQNKESVISVNQIEEFNNFKLLKFVVFESTGAKSLQNKPNENATSSQNELNRQKGQEASRENALDDSQPTFFFFQGQSHTQWVYSDRNRNLQVIFETKNNKLVPKSYKYIQYNGELAEVLIEPIHYSISNDGLSFSLLMQSISDKREKLAMFQFSYGPQPSMVELARQDFTFLLGPTKKAVLAPGTKIQLCSNVPSWLRRQVQKAFDSWNSILPKNHVKYSVAKSYPPYSDINKKCIYFIRDFNYTDPSLDNVSAGFAISGIHFSKGEIVDSDIIIPMNAWQRIFEARNWGSIEKPNSKYLKAIENYAYGVIAHELGHLLGLDHSFSHEHKIDSIMDYSHDRDFTEYDRDSIEELYSQFY